jgi:hypothetical protein
MKIMFKREYRDLLVRLSYILPSSGLPVDKKAMGKKTCSYVT